MVDTSRTALAKVKITIADSSGEIIANGLTDQLGKFSISQVPSGAYRVSVRLEDYVDNSITFLVQERHVTELDIALQMSPMVKLVQSDDSGSPPKHVDLRLSGDSALTLTVKDLTGAVIPNTTVSIEQVATNLKVEGKTDERGMYRLAETAAGKYSILIDARGFRQEKFPLELGNAEERFTIVTLEVAPTVYSDPAPVLQVEPVISSVNPEYLQYPDIANLPMGGGPMPLLMLNPAPAPKRKSGFFRHFFSSLGHKFGF